jgi:phenylpropionate dioxygenase-like ring-hydroxylating dioxygenase large terminal subunit
VTLMGRQLVLWRDSKGEWHAQNDACPHRLAALSDGFIDADNDQIVCSYQ